MKRANRGLVPSTHLIVNAAEGSKYTAAMKWNLPAISKLYVDFATRRFHWRSAASQQLATDRGLLLEMESAVVDLCVC